MKVSCSTYNFLSRQNLAQCGSSRPLLLAVVCFVLGAALTAFWFYRQSSAVKGQQLSEQTRASLANLPASVSIKFYSVLPAGSAGEELTAFSSRVAQLLAAVQEAGNGKIQISTVEGTADTNATAASADGIQAFNLDKGDACFLGLSISSGASKQSMPRLQPEWESALQYDLARTILAVAKAATPPVRPEVAKPSAAIVDSIKRLIPDVSTVSPEQASQIFHAEFMKECAAAGAEMETQIQAAQQIVVQAEAGGSAVEIAAARKNLLQVQLEQGEKMKQVAADLQTRLAVFQQMKAANPAK
jgi:hypothetical protein